MPIFGGLTGYEVLAQSLLVSIEKCPQQRQWCNWGKGGRLITANTLKAFTVYQGQF